MATYFAFLTKEGQNAIAWCVANPPNTVMFTQMAVGDLNGGTFPAFWAIGDSYTSGTIIVGSNKSLYTCISNHTATSLDEPGIGVNWATYWTIRTTIVNEQYRASVNAVYVHPNNPNWIVVEAVVPDDEGGWWIREVGLYANPGTGPILFGVAKFPPSYKPVLASGSGKDFYIRIVLVVTNVSVITLIMDPSVVIATQVYVNNYAYWATEADRLWNGVEFEATVAQDDVVYYNPATLKYGRAVADGTIKQRAVGFADLTPNYRNINGQIITHNECPYTFVALTLGETYYLSTTSPGKITSTPPNRYTVKVGTARAIGTMLVDIDDILSGYEDIAMSILPIGDVFFHTSVGIQNTLSVGADGGFYPCLDVMFDGSFIINGGVDGRWSIFHHAFNEVLAVDASHTLIIPTNVQILNNVQVLNSCATFNDGWRFEYSTGRLLSPNTDFWIEGPDAPGPGAQGAGDVSVTGGIDGYFGFFHGPMPPVAQVKVWGITPAHELTINTNGFYYGAITDPNHLVNKAYVNAAIPGSFSYVYGDVTRGLSLATVSITEFVLTKKKEIRTLRNGNFRILFNISCSGGTTNPDTVYGQIHKNGSPIGTLRSHTEPIGTTGNDIFTEDIPGWVVNDLIQVYCYHTNGEFPASIEDLDVRADEDLLAIL